jgi:hypothetical protein
MSKLDDILTITRKEHKSSNPNWDAEKKRFKDLMLELIGKDNYAPVGSQNDVEQVNRRLQAIRQKVNEL